MSADIIVNICHYSWDREQAYLVAKRTKASFEYAFTQLLQNNIWSTIQKGCTYDEKSQNCVKAAIAIVCTTCKRQLLFALLQKITFVCTIAKDNFCLHYCNR